MPPTQPRGWYRKAGYHHRQLVASALHRGREIVAAHGPLALTLRGLARDLGVSAAALVRFFRNIAGLRAAVAEFVLERMEAASALRHDAPTRTTRQMVGAWVAFAAENPGLYRLASGEPWHERRAGSGFHGVRRVPSPRLLLENAFARGRRPTHLGRARRLAVAVHGLALAQMDGVPPPDVSDALDRAAAEFDARR
ncbi:MAG: TetR/AcrR family transcriptional regulator [Myxococcota bacterium]